MIFDIGPMEFVALAVLALVVLGPDKLPRYAAEAARMIARLRDTANSARDDVRRELGPEFADISLQDLNPRTLVRKHLLDPLELDELELDPLDGPDKPAARPGPGEPRAGSASPPPYDPDTT